jgi:hypothetical protein
MTRFRQQRVVLTAGCLLLTLAVVGCDVDMGSWNKARHDRAISLAVPLAAGSTVDVDTQYGAVTIAGADVTDVNVIADIFARAPTRDEARELAEQVEIRLEAIGNTLRIRATKPPLERNRSIGVSYTLTVPRQTSVVCGSSYGSLRIVNVQGSVTGRTSSGSIKAEDIEGAVDLSTSYGTVTCRRVTGQSVTLNSSSGEIDVAEVRGTLEAKTAYGRIKCTDFSDGDLDLNSSSGTITVRNATFGHCVANTSYGTVIGGRLEGKTIRLTSASGTVNVTDARAETIELSTSYGPVKARDITTGDLKAGSSSGSVNVAFTPSTPTDLKAHVKSGYGSINVATPPGFAGTVRLATDYGSVRTELPVTISGSVSKKKLNGTIGQGTGSLDLETKSGSIDLR